MTATPTAAPLLSVVIPTRERADTLVHALATALDHRSRRFEVIVSDNCSQDDTRQVVTRIEDDRLRYVNTGARVSMSDNWEFALRHARGRYVLFIGDDDGIMPGAVDRLEPLLETSAARIFTWPRTTYMWPTPTRGPQSSAVPSPGARVEVDILDAARFSIRTGGYRFERPPSVYHSVFHRDVLASIGERAGRVFPTPAPDVFTAFAAPGIAPRALALDFLVTVLGHAPKSNGGRAGGGRASALQLWEDHLSEHGPAALHPTLFPGVPARVNMIPDSLLVAKDLFPEAYAATAFGYGEMWANAYRLREYFAWETSWADIVRLRRDICRYQPFSLRRFVAASAVHAAAEHTRSLRHGRRTGLVPCTAATIVEFVRSQKLYM